MNKEVLAKMIRTAITNILLWLGALTFVILGTRAFVETFVQFIP